MLKENVSEDTRCIIHDINNMLTCLLGNIGLAKLMVGNSDGTLFYTLENAENAGRDIQRLTKTLRKKNVNDKNKLISIPKFLQEVVNYHSTENNITFHLHLQENLWMVKGSEIHIKQVLNNVIINAKEAMPAGGFISIKAENSNLLPKLHSGFDRKDYVVITIKDNGIGIPSDILKEIFQFRFTTKRHGNGMGLPIALSIVNKYDGYLTMESEQNIGTTCTIYLPRDIS